MEKYKSVIKDVPEDIYGNVLVTCYTVRAKSLSYWKSPITFMDYGEADAYFNDLALSKIKDEPITQIWIEEHLEGYWNLGGMEIKTYDHGSITC